MASRESTSRAPSIFAISTELFHGITSNLNVLDIHSLRLTCHHFHAVIPPVPPPTHSDLLNAETIHFLACVGCKRLRRSAKFSTKMVKKHKRPGGRQARSRFCIECGRRPLPGTHRYMLGQRWEEGVVPYVRCIRCTEIDIAPDDKIVKLCLSCHQQNLERKRAAEEQDRLWKEVNDQKQRRLLREERRRNWIHSGRAQSEFSSHDPASEQYSESIDWGFGIDMNSAHS
ncbi:hypothetical protein GLAREA_11507 [Glarea lozoyensis ATCC 20868]|uniref:F-box domain-containing protein n=1 Tax=Glarea lozoyensis (strain ATCC 20868 / MF5171) TaxID=1116229 RepID=S3CYM2_GLAL2|nr:uncharacterized protein GLAREA_11507 [Glarea lozoyensis ATCC 20868]EPE24926.1 hypothetical protein GLAREA_11507 [Glarea lozoyensis ATCC 20868]